MTLTLSGDQLWNTIYVVVSAIGVVALFLKWRKAMNENAELRERLEIANKQCLDMRLKYNSVCKEYLEFRQNFEKNARKMVEDYARKMRTQMGR